MSWNAMVMQIKTTMNAMIMTTTVMMLTTLYYGHQPEVDFMHPWALVLVRFSGKSSL